MWQYHRVGKQLIRLLHKAIAAGNVLSRAPLRKAPKEMANKG